MRLPWIVRQIGNASGKDRIYIEDYACSFLENCRKEESLLPVRAALYGYALQKGESHIYLIYGCFPYCGRASAGDEPGADPGNVLFGI